MASACGLLSEVQLHCAICLDVFTEPITTPCGHNYCKACITHYWNTNVFQCPLCNRRFYNRPEVVVNTLISEIAGQFRKSQQQPAEPEKEADRGIQWHVFNALNTMKTLGQQMEKLYDAELRRLQQHAVDVTLDPDTAHPYLILSEDGKRVSDGTGQQTTDNKERFFPCGCVLGQQSFSSGRFYYEVQVKEKTDWDLGVARESINRKGFITLSPNNGYWTIGLRNGNEYTARLAGPPVLLPVREKLEKVGVFVDYEEGLVSFFDVKNRVHIYSFTGCTFSEKLYAFFCPCFRNSGKNSAPLIISPVIPAIQVVKQ